MRILSEIKLLCKKGLMHINNIQIFSNNQFSKLGTDKQLALLGGLTYILGKAADATTEKEAWEYMRAASIVGHPLDCETFNHLYGAVACKITHKFLKNEFYYQGLFKTYAEQIIPGCEVVKKKTDSKNIPDAWIKMCYNIAPVEVKIGNFNHAALKQLMRYMETYDSSMGVAVGRELEVKLPRNIIFVSLKQLEDLEDAANNL